MSPAQLSVVGGEGGGLLGVAGGRVALPLLGLPGFAGCGCWVVGDVAVSDHSPVPPTAYGCCDPYGCWLLVIDAA